jgi:hypothetical protein
MSLYRFPTDYAFPKPIKSKRNEPLLIERGPFRTSTLHWLMLTTTYGVEVRLCRVNRQKVNFLTQNREVQFEVMPTTFDPFEKRIETFDFEDALSRRVPTGGAA